MIVRHRLAGLSALACWVVLCCGCSTSLGPGAGPAADTGSASGGGAPAETSAVDDATALRDAVLATERAFARTMAERDPAAFRSFLAAETVFFSGPDAIRGKDAVAEAWAPFFEGRDAPFSWDPDQVEVLDSGTLALSTGPVYDADGRVTARFQSIWRREPSGAWRIVFDRGSPVCAQTPNSGG